MYWNRRDGLYSAKIEPLSSSTHAPKSKNKNNKGKMSKGVKRRQRFRIQQTDWILKKVTFTGIAGITHQDKQRKTSWVLLQIRVYNIFFV